MHSEARKAPDMASTPGRAASSMEPAAAWTPLPMASSTGLGVLAIGEAASRASVDMISVGQVLEYPRAAAVDAS
jgi:hypothetical protein